jgi:AAA domain
MVALETQEFFRILYGDEAPGFLPIFTHTPIRTRWVVADSPAEAARIAVQSGRQRDTYFGIGLHREALGERQRGTAARVIALSGLWADIDVKGEAHQADNLPPTVKDALRITEAIPLKPTLIVHSGHGLQVWWLFKELWIFEDEDERREAQKLSRRFQATLDHRAKRYGWQMDGTHDISRVFRPPGTLNHKLKPVEVRVMRYDEGARYNPADFEQYVLEGAPEGEHEVNFEGNGHDPEAARALLGLLRDRISSRILDTIEGGPDAFEPLRGGDGSPSGADASVCEALVEAGLTDPQIRSFFRTFPIGTKGKYAREGRRGDDYLARTIKSQRQWVAENRNRVDIEDDLERTAEEVRPEEVGRLLSGVEPEEVSWQWPSWLALGKLTLVDGDPGLGKSAMTLDLAARVSAGKPFPDGTRCEAGGVVLLSAEDGLADTIRPRLDAAGADTSKVLSLATVPDEDGHNRLLSIPEDLGIMEEGIRRVRARLVVVDPLMAFLSANANSHRDQDVRRALAPLAGLAERTGAAVLVVRHLNKAAANNPLYRGGGSIGIIGAARMAFVVGREPQDENRRVLASTKNNLAKPPRSLMFTLEESEGGAVRINWLGESEVSAKDLLATPQDHEQTDARSEAAEFLQDILSEGPVPANEVIRDAEDAGIAEKTLAAINYLQ